jgi:Putative peptidoglycan binding domain
MAVVIGRESPEPLCADNPKMSTIRGLGVGSVGAPVRKLERELKQRGLLDGPIDHRFDERTKAAVRRFEHRHGFHEDGFVGGRINKRLDLGLTNLGPRGDGQGVFKVVSMNVKSNPEMSQDKVVHDVRRAAKSGDIIGWQEIGPERYRDAIRALPGFDHFMPKGLETPISWRSKDWKLLDSGVEQMHEGRKGVSPHRTVAWVKLKNKETGKTVVHMNTHLVSGAWNSKQQATDPWRQKMWSRHIDEMGRLIERFEKKGHPVTISGDFNRNHFKVFGIKVAYDSGLRAGTHGGATLDYVMHTRHEALKKLSNRVDDHFESDHNAVIVRYDLD